MDVPPLWVVASVLALLGFVALLATLAWLDGQPPDFGDPDDDADTDP